MPAERLVDLTAQPADVDIDDVRISFEVVVPYPGEDLGLGLDVPGPADEVLEHLELPGGEAQLDLASPDPPLPGSIRRSPTPTGAGLRPVPRRSRARTRATSTGKENGLVR